jgi:hypothetical protein
MGDCNFGMGRKCDNLCKMVKKWIKLIKMGVDGVLTRRIERELYYAYIRQIVC